jgi:hypothetical protein
MTGDPIYEPDDVVWLTPRTLGAPAVCWRQPKAKILSRPSTRPGYYVVRLLEDAGGLDGNHRAGCNHLISFENIRRTDPHRADRARSTTSTRPREPMTWEDGSKEVALFDLFGQGGSRGGKQ